jgi:RNA polymerase sigma-B factor
VVLNLKVAADIARQYQGRGVAFDDLEQVANLGLVKAAQAFDPAHGSDFLSYAVPTMRGEVRRYFRDLGWTVRPTRAVQEAQAGIASAEGELFQELGRSPRPSELAEHMGVDPEVVQEALAANGCFAPTSLDTSVNDHSPAERLGHDEAGFDSAEARVMLLGIMRDLTPRERRILEMRFFGGCTQKEIGVEVGVTQMQVSRLLSRLLERLRARLEGQAGAA